MYLKGIGDINSMMVIYLLLYSAQFQSLPDSFRIIALHYTWLRSFDDMYGCTVAQEKSRQKIEHEWKTA